MTGAHYGDVWSLDLGDDAASWEQLDAGSGPSLRRSASAVYDCTRDRLLLAFGRDGSAFTSELWSYDLEAAVWTRLP